MPKVRATDFNIQTGNVSSVSVVMPPHQAGDVLVVFAGKDDATGTDPTTATAGWAMGGSGASAGATTAAVRCGWFIKRAESSAEADLVITSSDADSWSIIAVSVAGVGQAAKTVSNASWAASVATFTATSHGYTTGQIVAVTGVTPAGYNGTYKITVTDANTFTGALTSNPGAFSAAGSAIRLVDADTGNGNTDSTGAPYAVTGVTTNFDKSMVLYMCASGATGCPVPYPGLQLIDAVDSANEGVAIAYTVKGTAGATGTKNFYADALNVNTIGFCCALIDDGSGQNAAYWKDDYATLIHPFRGSSTIITSDVWGTALTNYPTAGKAAVSACFQVDQSGGPSYVDYTTAANNTTDADVAPFPATEAAGAEGTGDWFAIGHDKPFFALLFDLAGCTQGVGGAVAWEYWNGSAWVALTSVTDGTTGFTVAVADNLQVRWAPPPKFNWTKRSINGSASLFFVRARCSTAYTTNPTISQVHIGGLSLIYDAVAASGDSGVIVYENAANVTPAASAIQAGGTYIDLGQTVDLANKIIVGTFQFSLPRDYADAARRKEGGGVHVMFADTSFNRKTWCIGAYLDQQTSDAQRNRFAIDWEQATDTTIARTATDPSDTIADVGIFMLAPRGAGSVAFSHMMAVAPASAIVNGGSSGTPITFDEFRRLGDASPVQLFRDDIYMIPVTIGGADAAHVHWDNFTLKFPAIATAPDDIYTLTPRTQAHYDSGVLGLKLDGRASDTIKLTNGKISSDSTWKFEVASTASASCTWDTDGLLVINANVTLRDVHNWAGSKWQGCPSFVTNGSDVTGATFVNTKVDVSTPANAALITDCSFTKTTGTQHAIEIAGTAADITLDGLTFTGYAGSNGSTGNEAIYVNIASGSMTINITGGGSTPSIRTAGATVTVQNAVTVKVTVKDSVTLDPIQNARVLVEKTSDGTDIMTGLTDASGVIQTTFAYVSDTAVTGAVRRASAAYGTLYKPNAVVGTITAAGLDVTVLLTSDE